MTDGALRFTALRGNQQKGSKPRCHLLTSGTKDRVAARLSTLISPWGEVHPSDSWMPGGFADCEEAQLHTAERIIDAHTRASLATWWLAVSGPRTTTPNWDIASTCTIGNKPGVLLVEAKAHGAELRNEERGKPLGSEDGKGVSIDSRRNHVRIGACIQEASVALAGESKLPWALSRDWNYQMANRFAWAWKLTELGVPVILVYLGFLGCDEMRKGVGQQAFSCARDWEELVYSHSYHLFPRDVWNRELRVHGQSLIPLIRTYDLPLCEAALTQ